MNGTFNRQYKDTLFRIIFGEHKENALVLYNAINGTDYSDEDQLIITTIEDALFVGMKNDVSFLLEDTMNLYEHQSTLNPNMPLRGLEYFSVLYSNYIDSLRGGRAGLYRSSRIHIPTPKYYVFYNGDDLDAGSVDLRLSDAYRGKGDLEVIAHVLNINYDKEKGLLGKCKPLQDYAKIVELVRKYCKEGLPKEAAARRAVEDGIEEGILSDILRKEKNRVISSILTGLTEEEAEQLYKEEGFEKGYKEGIEQGIEKGIEQGIEQGIEKGIEQGIEKGIEQGIDQGRMEMILKMKEAGMSDEEIERIAGMKLKEAE